MELDTSPGAWLPPEIPTPISLLFEIGQRAIHGRKELMSIGSSLAAAATASDWKGYRVGLLELIRLRVAEPGPDVPDQTYSLHEHIVRIFSTTLPALLAEHPDLVKECIDISKAVTSSDVDFDLSDRITSLCTNAEQRGIGLATVNPFQELLVALIENIDSLAEEDSWLTSQISQFKNTLLGGEPANIQRATEKLKEIAAGQLSLKSGLADSRKSTTAMVDKFLGSLDNIAGRTEEHHNNMTELLDQLGSVRNPKEFEDIVRKVIDETQAIGRSAIESQKIVAEARAQAKLASNRVADLEAKLKQMGDISQKDPLTGCLNRRGLDKAFAEGTSQFEKDDLPLCVAMIDIDHFKRLNDTYGHATGDIVLAGLVDTIQKGVRDTDIVARLGGEEFVVLLPNVDPALAKMVIERIQGEFAQFFKTIPNVAPTTFSCGIVNRRKGEVLADAIARADENMYRAKRAGRNQVVNDPGGAPARKPSIKS